MESRAPLVVRWHALELDPPQAGASQIATVELENAGSATWRTRGAAPALEPYAPGGGRTPAFAHPLVCPSLLPPLEPNTEVAGLPAWRPEGDEPWIYDARATIRLRSRSGRRRG